MKESDRIKTTLLFREDGHASDLALSVLVDGETALLARELTDHVDECELCVERMATLAHFAFPLELEIRAIEREKRRLVVFPKAAFALVLAIPLAAVLRSALAGGRGNVPHELLAFVRTLRSGLPMLTSHFAGALFGAAIVAALGAIVAGVFVARRASSHDEGVL